MKGRCGIRKKNERKVVCGLWSVPDDVFVDCLSQLSRMDLVALAMVSRRHRSYAVSTRFWALRYRMRNVDPYLYVFMHMHPTDPTPAWFLLHPVQRRLKLVGDSNLYPAAGSCFVKTNLGIYTIGGLLNGKPTSQVTFLNCIEHRVYVITPMKMARSGASAGLIDKKKIYVFGGCCWEDGAADSSNWVEVYDIETGTWEFLSVSTPKMPLRIQQCVVMDEKHVYAVDEDGEIFVFSTSENTFWAEGERESNPETKNDWRLFDQTFFCRGIGGRVLWRLPRELEWKEVKGLEELQQQHIIKLCAFSVQRMAIFWEAPRGPDQISELWYAEITLKMTRGEGEDVWEVWGNIEWSGAILSDSSYTTGGLNLLFADSLYL